MPRKDKSSLTQDRYDAAGPVENQFEPASRGRVLRNLLGIKSRKEMETLETRSGRKAYFAAIRAGHTRDYRPMTELMKLVVKRTLRRFGASGAAGQGQP